MAPVLIHHFDIKIGFRDAAITVTVPPGPSNGVSLGTSHDGSTTVAILGATGRDIEAGTLAQKYIELGRSAESCAHEGIGVVLIDHLAAAVYVVAAPIGLRQIYWSDDSGTLSVASSPFAIGTVPARTLQPQRIFDYVYFHVLPGPTTIHPGINKLDGGHLLRWDGHQTCVSRYWRPVFGATNSRSEAEASRTLHELLEQAVARCLEDGVPVGAFLSGGLDSSTITGIAARIQPGLQTVSMGFDVQGYDEMEYARLAARHFATKPLEYYVTPEDLVTSLPTIAAAFPEPFGNSSAAAVYHCARIAREHGLQRLLAGDGGDEIFGGNERYAKQMVFERYGLIPASLRRHLLEPAISAAAGLTTAFPFGKAQSYVQQANVRLPDRLQSYNFLHRHDPKEIFTDSFLAAVDQQGPLRSLRDEYDSPIASSAIDRMLFLDWKFTLHDNDLVKVNTMCALAGVQVAYPMLDQKLVEFSMSLPAEWKVQRGQIRWFFKRAMRGFLPDQIIDKQKHGFGLPFGVWTRTHEGLRRMVADCLGSLAERGIFHRDFLIKVRRLHDQGHAAYYGELVWLFLVLELWLRRHAPEANLTTAG